MTISISNAQRSRACDAITARLNNGYLRIYSGARPATANAALSGNTLLAELRYGATAFGAASNGVANANAMTADSSADATGTATFFRTFESDGSTVVFDGTVQTAAPTGAAGEAVLQLPTTSIAAGVSVSITSHSFTVTG